jgi:pimeloyl-ACP methyl ester carboxylesterase
MPDEDDESIKRLSVSFGDYVTANVYWPAAASPPPAPTTAATATAAHDGPSDASPRLAADAEAQESSQQSSASAASRGESTVDDLGANGPVNGIPAVIWLHPYSYATGYTATYGQASPWKDLVMKQYVGNSSYVVLAYDQIGFATRVREGGNSFYARYGGRSSLFGHMLKDARAAVDFLFCRSKQANTDSHCSDGERFTGPYVNTLNKIPTVDPERIYIAGYSLGGNVALHLAALDPRVAGVAAFGAFTPFRTDLSTGPTGGIRRLYEMHALIPRLGLWDTASWATDSAESVTNTNTTELQLAVQAKIPYDYDELIGAIAPRPCLLYTPQQDRDANFADVKAAVAIAAKAWEAKGVADKLVHEAPEEYTKMEANEVKALIKWLNGLNG